MFRKLFLSPRLGVAARSVVTIGTIGFLSWSFFAYARFSHVLAVVLGMGTIAGVAWYISPEKVRQLQRQAAGLCRSTWREMIGNDPACPECGKKGLITMEGPVGIPDVGQCRYKRYCSCPAGHIWTTEQVVQRTARIS